MCGIAGFFYLRPAQPPKGRSSNLRAMVGSLRHRGPDSEGFFEEDQVGLGIRRLRVIDLDTGDQPISNESGTCWIVFNGEIYNYQPLRKRLEEQGARFKTRTDTEVILKLYEKKGPACVQDLNGMYAFAIYDAQEKSLFLARDPLGIKPLFYYQDDEKFVFGSEIKALLAFPGISRVLDLEAMAHFLSLNYLPSPWTLLQGIRQLEGGHSFLLKNGRAEFSRFWNPSLQVDSSLSETEIIRKTGALLRQAVQTQLVADVPVGAFLSGGLDSSSLVALIRESCDTPLETFSVGFEESSYDETPHARKVAQYFGTRHHEVFLKPSDVISSLGELVTQLDQPLADPAAMALFQLSRLTRRHVTVALSGDGSDEIFVGYPTYHANRYLRWYRHLPVFLKEGLIGPLVRNIPASAEKFSFDYRAKKFLEGARFEPQKAHFWWRTIFSDVEKQKICTAPFRERIANVDSFEAYRRYFEEVEGLDFTSQCLYADLRVWLAGNNLHKVDSMSMAHSLEARVPYLDQELVEFLMRVPPAVKFKGNQNKYLLKRVMKGLLPREVIERKKAGWHIPLARWFRYELKEYLSECFEQAPPGFYEILEKVEIQKVLGEHFQGKKNNSFKIWGLLILHEWFRIYEPRVEARSLVGLKI